MFTNCSRSVASVFAAVCTLALGACNRELVRDLDGEQANLAIVELDRAGVAADKVAADNGTFRVTVASSQLAHAASVLKAAELPRPPRTGVQAMFGKSSLVPTPLEERARLYSAIAADLERTLEVMPAVERARVHLSIDTLASLGEAPQPPTAAVVIRLRPARNNGNDFNPDDVKRVVAKAAVVDPARIELVVHRAPPADGAPMNSAAAMAVVPGRERSVYFALGALCLVVLLSLGLLYASRRLQLERATAMSTTAMSTTAMSTTTKPQPSNRLQPG